MITIKEIIRYIVLLLAPSYFLWRGKRKAYRENVVFTLTTLPSRIKNIKPTIASVLNQTILPETIVLNLPKFSKREQKGYTIPKYLENHPRIFINEIKDDLGPATKLLPTLKLFEKQEKLIIVGDDDEIYPKRLFENYLNHEASFKNAVMTLVGWNAPRSFNHSDKKIKYGAIGSIPKTASMIEEPVRVDCVQGASTFAIRPSFLSKDVFNYKKAPKEAFFVDDIWVSGNLAKGNVPVYVIPAPFRYARMKVPSHLVFSETLHKKENKGGENNASIYEYFRKEWYSMQN